jgi:DNA-binding SARP family transcriptional activator
VGEGRLDVSAKFAPPAPAGLARGRLLDLGAHRVVLVLAPAGHGKTTLLGQIASRFPGTVVWYRIDAADRDPAELARRIGRALGKAGLAGDCRSFDDVAAALDAAGRDLLLVFDDFHAVAGSAAEHGLARMIALAPPSLRVVLGARRVVGLDVPALRVYGAVHVVDADDLRFRSWEVERLFREIYHQPLPPEDAATLSQRTGGWAAGLAMFHLLTEGRPPAQRRRALADLSRGSRLVRSYLVREVLGDLPPELREFLRRTSALGVLTGALCDALLETTGSQTVLEELEQRRLFTTTPDDGRQFRYHQVLLDHLELELTEHLGAAASREWYGRAAELLLDAGEVPAAFRAYVRAEDWAAVEQLLHRRGAEVVAGPLGPLESMLPHGLVASDPWLLLARARRLAAEGALTEAVAAFRLAHSAAEDSQLAARCLEEARTAALWLPDADPVARTWAATIRAATQRNPRTLLPATMGLPGAEGRLAAGVVALLAGDLGVAAGLLREAADHPDADIGVVAPAACAGRVVRLLAGKDLDDPATDLEALMLDAEVGGWPWLSRIGRALLALDTPGTAPAVEPCDPWGAAVVTFVDGLGRRAAEPLRAAADRFTELGAPVPALWAACLATALSTRRVATNRARSAGAFATPVDLGTAVSRARTLGLRDLPAVVDAWAAGTAAPTVPPPRVAAAPPEGTIAAVPAAPAVPLALRLLGCTEISIDGVAVDLSTVRPRARSTLRLLALRAGNAVHRDVLVASLWPDVDEEAALRSLQVAISSLRSVLGGRTRTRSTLLARNGETYCLQLPPGSRSDVRDFDARLADARTRRHDGDAPGERAALAAALGHYGGDLLPEEGAAEWVVAERDRLRIAAAGGWCALGRRLGDDGDFSEAVDAVRAGLRLDAYSDDGWRLLVDLHTRAGNPAAAQAAAMEHAQVLAELGVETEVRAPS